ncbi:uncharacterized protein LOC135924153 [Gordionus sp. m RMFG-2023]|uniref:uncharacterized protein LOC135924153 n=1 Tax=Gordionus sp. m RMFG-2023 TaxID=3053472 RepID=UPI0031FD1091
MLISRRRLNDVIDCKVIPREDIAAQHKLLVMDLHIINKSTQNNIKLEPCIKWGRFKSMTDAFSINANIETIDSSHVSEKIWTDLSHCQIDIRLDKGRQQIIQRTMLCWWNEAAKTTIQEKKNDKTKYKKSKRIATKVVARAKAMAYDDMYEELHTKEGYKIYRLAIQREKNSRDINRAPKESKIKIGN